MILELWKQLFCSGADFILTPAELVVDGERRYTHPLTSDWAIRMQQLIQTEPAIRAHAAQAGIAMSHLLAFSLFSDKTNVGTLSAYPMQAVAVHGALKALNALWSGGRGVVAYIPVASRPSGADENEKTERRNELLARCLNKVSRDQRGSSCWQGKGHFSCRPYLL